MFLINRLSSKVIHDEIPFEHLYHQQPDYASLIVFGCACWPNLHPYNAKKLQFRSKRCVFLGYNNLHKGYKCLDPSEGRVYISHDVAFDEYVFPFAAMHPNVGARLRAEISLLPDSLLNSSTGAAGCGENPAQNSDFTSAISGDIVGSGRHFMCLPAGRRATPVTDSLVADSLVSGVHTPPTTSTSGPGLSLTRLRPRGRLRDLL